MTAKLVLEGIHADGIRLTDRLFDRNFSRACSQTVGIFASLATRSGRKRIAIDSGTYRIVLLRAVRNEASQTGPKRRGGNELKPSLTLRVSIPGSRKQSHSLAGVGKMWTSVV
jgi:hypothetical protein